MLRLLIVFMNQKSEYICCFKFLRNVMVIAMLELSTLSLFVSRDFNQTIQLVQWNIIACSVDSAQSTIKHHCSMMKTWVVLLLISTLRQ